jgi:hypothetical protein
MVYPMGGTVDGAKGDHILLAPPFIVEGSQVDAIVERLGAALEAALADVRSPRKGRERVTQRAQCLRKARSFPISGERAADSAPKPTAERT